MGPRAARDVAALVFAGGDPPHELWVRDAAPADVVIAADSGLAHARVLDVHVDLVVGDLDSVDPRVLDAALADGTKVQRHPAAKDATDLELALHAAMEHGATSIRVVGMGGGRFDHFLANVLLLASPRFVGCHVDAFVDGAHLTLVRDRAELIGTPGGLCSLLPIGGPAAGIETHGLRYPLRSETLSPGTTRGVSNEFLDTRASVALASGVLLAIVPMVVPEARTDA